MLVLSRKVGERILIGDKISVTVVRISGGGVRIGIEAPAEMAVVREELQQELLSEKNSNEPPLANGHSASSEMKPELSDTMDNDSPTREATTRGPAPSNAAQVDSPRASQSPDLGDDSRQLHSSEDAIDRGIPRSTRRKPR